MALKPDRNITQWRLDYYLNEVAEKGGFVSASVAGSGVAMDGVNMATYATVPSGKQVLGCLLDSMENLGTRLPRNHYSETVGLNSKVGIASEGWVVTNKVVTGVSPAAGDTAYLAQSGFISNVQSPSQAPKVGRFETTKDEDGFVKVSINIPL